MWKARSKKACVPTECQMYLSRVIPRQDFYEGFLPRKGPLSASRWMKTFSRNPWLNNQPFSSNIVLEEHVWSFGHVSHFVMTWFSMGVLRRMNVEQTVLSYISFDPLRNQSTKRRHPAKSNQMNKEKSFRGLTLSGVWSNNVAHLPTQGCVYPIKQL